MDFSFKFLSFLFTIHTISTSIPSNLPYNYAGAIDSKYNEENESYITDVYKNNFTCPQRSLTSTVLNANVLLKRFRHKLNCNDKWKRIFRRSITLKCVLYKYTSTHIRAHQTIENSCSVTSTRGCRLKENRWKAFT